MNEEHENGESSAPGSEWSLAGQTTPGGQMHPEDEMTPVEPVTRIVPSAPVSSAPHDAVADPGGAVSGVGWTWVPSSPPPGTPASPPYGAPAPPPPYGAPAPPPPYAAPAPPPPGSPAGFPGVGGWSWIPAPPPPGTSGAASGGPHWVYSPSPYWVAPPVLPGASTPPARRGAAWTAAVVMLVVLLAMAAGFGIGRIAWRSSSAASLSPAASPSTTLPSSGSGGFPFGSGTGSPSSGSSASGGPADASAIASGVDPALVDVNTTLGYQSAEAAGTGIVLTSNGEVLTNNHVIDGATSISVTDVGNGRVYSATVVGYDRSSDIAVLRLKGASGLKVASIGNSSEVRVGQAVVGIGNAGGVGGTPEVAGGSVVALNRSITATEQDGGNPENLKGLIEVNAGIQPGDSGGPLVDTAGKVLGMDTAASAGFSFQTSGTQGYAIPINSAIAIAKQIASGHASTTIHLGRTGFLGVGVLATAGGSPGALVVRVQQGAPAASAGLVAGDVIRSLDGKAVATPQGLTTLIQQYHPGDRVQLTWTDSSGARHSATLRLAVGPAA